MVILEPQMTIFVALNNAVERRLHTGESVADIAILSHLTVERVFE